jgi:hypothetical protein
MPEPGKGDSSLKRWKLTRRQVLRGIGASIAGLLTPSIGRASSQVRDEEQALSAAPPPPTIAPIPVEPPPAPPPGSPGPPGQTPIPVEPPSPGVPTPSPPPAPGEPKEPSGGCLGSVLAASCFSISGLIAFAWSIGAL